MSTAARTMLFEADSMMDVDDHAASGFVYPMPCQLIPVPSQPVGEGRITIWPRPRLRRDEHGRPVALVLDMAAWCIAYHQGSQLQTRDESGVTFPLLADHQQAARDIATAFAQHVSDGGADPLNPDYLARWCRWWCAHHHDAHPTDDQG